MQIRKEVVIIVIVILGLMLLGNNITGNVARNELGGWDYCKTRTCQVGQGDCDRGQCASGLKCVNNVGGNYNFGKGVDVCERTTPAPAAKPIPTTSSFPGWSYCKVSNKCGHGEGDCDRDSQCQAGLKCVKDAGADYYGNKYRTVDVCESTQPICPQNCILKDGQCWIDFAYYGNKYLSASQQEKELLKQEMRSKNCLK